MVRDNVKSAMTRPGWFTPLRLLAAAIVCTLAACDAFSPAFLDVLGPSIAPPQGPDSSGHVAVVMRNDTLFDERLTQHLVNRGLDAALIEDPELRPFVRMVLQITFVNGDALQVEFTDGSAAIIDPAVRASDFPDLTRTQQDNLVVQCDVARVDLLQLPSVFVPAFFEATRIDPGDENTPPFRVRTNITTPQFVVLQLDQSDALGNATVFRNVDIRDAPAPAIAPNCGSVVTITVSGTLSLPFERNANGDDTPGALVTDQARILASPGRFRISVGIR